MVILGLFLALLILLSAIFYKRLNKRETLWQGLEDFLKELLFSNGLWHPYVNPVLQLSVEDASELVATFDELLLHPVLLNYETEPFHGWIKIQAGFLTWKEPFRDLPKQGRLNKVAQLVCFFYRTHKGLILTRDNIRFVSVSDSHLEFMLPMNETGKIV